MEPMGTLVAAVAFLAVGFESYRSALLLGTLAFFFFQHSM